MKTPHWSTMSQDRLNCCALMSIENDILREIDFTGIITEFASGPSIKYVMLFLANFDPPPPVTLCHTSRDPAKARHTSRTPPIFSRSSTKNPDRSPLYKISINCSRVFCPGVCLLFGMFCSGWFLSIPPSIRIHLLQQKGKHYFKFHVSYV